jgi:membrane-bound metal-dependent hydrolase YbcI (DUF457 family)
LGYILGKGSAKGLKTNLNIPLALTLTVIPDTDIILGHLNGLAQILPHRGPMHSVLAMLIVFIPFFAVYRQKAIPYFIALIQHPLIGDYLTGGQLQLLWPITSQTFGTVASILSIQNIIAESTLFVVSIIILIWTKDIFVLFKHNPSNIVLAIPTFTVLLPTFLNYPMQVPIALIVPHLVYTIVFSAVIGTEFFRLFRFKGDENPNLPSEKRG